MESIYRSYTLYIWSDSEPKKVALPTQTKTAKYLYWSIFKKSRLLGFGVFIDGCTYRFACVEVSVGWQHGVLPPHKLLSPKG